MKKSNSPALDASLFENIAKPVSTTPREVVAKKPKKEPPLIPKDASPELREILILIKELETCIEEHFVLFKYNQLAPKLLKVLKQQAAKME